MSTKDELFEELADTLGEADFSYNEFDPSDEAVTYIRRGTLVETVAECLIAAGYRKIFDGDCGLSNVKDPTDREASEAWMRWANLVSGEDPDGIAAMKQMLTEFGYRKPRTITTLAELEEAHMVVVRTAAGTIANIVNGRAYCFGYEASAPVATLALPVTVIHEPEAKS